MTTVTSSLCGCAGAERVDVGEQRVEHLLRRLAAMRVRAREQAIVGELLARRVHRLGDAVAEQRRSDRRAPASASPPRTWRARTGRARRRRFRAGGCRTPTPAAARCGRRCSRCSEPSGAEHAVEARQEPRFDRAAEQAVVEPRHQRRGAGLIGRFGAEHAEHRRREQRRRRSLARHVADDEAELAGRQIDVVVEVAADRAAGDRRGRGREERALAVRDRQQRLLNRRRDLAAPARTSPCRAPRGRAARSRSRAPLRPTACRAPTARGRSAARRARGCRDTARR